MGDTENLSRMGSAASEDLRQLHDVVEVLAELVTDCKTLSQELRRNWTSGSDPDDAFCSDALESLHALNDEVRLRLSQLDKLLKSKGTKP